MPTGRLAPSAGCGCASHPRLSLGCPLWPAGRLLVTSVLASAVTRFISLTTCEQAILFHPATDIHNILPSRYLWPTGNFWKWRRTFLAPGLNRLAKKDGFGCGNPGGGVNCPFPEPPPLPRLVRLARHNAPRQLALLGTAGHTARNPDSNREGMEPLEVCSTGRKRHYARLMPVFFRGRPGFRLRTFSRSLNLIM